MVKPLRRPPLNVAVVVLLLSVAGAARRPVAASEQQVFRASVNLIPVEVQVLDAGGSPIAGLDVSNFEVTIRGRRQPIVSVDRVEYAVNLEPAPHVAVGGASARNQWPVSGPVQRTFVLVVDSASLSDGEGFRVTAALQSFVARLSPNDAVGFFTLPHGRSLRPTTDRLALNTVIRTIAGGEGLRASQHNLTNAEAIEIMNSPGNPSGSTPGPVPRSGRGSAPRQPDPDDALAQVQMRECGTLTDRGCTNSILIDAQTMRERIDHEVTESLTALKGLLGALRDHEGRKTVVLVSSGMPVSDRPGGWNSGGGEGLALGHEAARAQASIYTLHIDRAFNKAYSAQSRDIRNITSLSREFDDRVLFEMASGSGGALFSVPVDAGEAALDRLLTETSSVYLLGVSADNLDLDGKTYALGVKVKTPEGGTIARSRRFVMLQPSRSVTAAARP